MTVQFVSNMDTDVANQAVAESHDNKQTTNQKLIIVTSYRRRFKVRQAPNSNYKSASFLLFYRIFENVGL